MNKAAHFSEICKQLAGDPEELIQLIEHTAGSAMDSDVIDDVMLIMHDDGSVNMIEMMDNGMITGEVISSSNILKVLHHYRPFKEVFKGGVQ